MDVWTEVDEARRDLVGTLDGLTPEQWDQSSLCEGWAVRDVVGHLAGARDIKMGKVLVGLATSGFKFDKFMDKASRERGAQPTDQLRAQIAELVGYHKPPPMTKPADVLTDTVVHTQDIRRALSISTPVPVPRLVEIADFIKDHKFYGTAKKRAGLRLEATDCEWSAGEGLAVRGPLEALVMALMGRRIALADLQGEGVATLAERL